MKTKPMTIRRDVVLRLWEIYQQNLPNEACGVLLSSDGDTFTILHRLVNYAPDPTQEFWMAPDELETYTHQSLYPVVATWHTHPGQRYTMSAQDRHFANQTGLPMAIVSAIPSPCVMLYHMMESVGPVCRRFCVEEAVR